MRTRMRVGLVAAVIAAGVLAVVPTVGAQNSGQPDLGSGWELRLETPMPVGTIVAGSTEAGWVARDFDGGEFWSRDGFGWEQTSTSTADLAVRDLAANSHGFVATREMTPTTSVLFSSDGREWETVDAGPPRMFHVRVDSGPGGFLVAGEYQCGVVVKFSANGRDWVRADLPEGCGSFHAAPMGDGWIAVAKLDGEVAVLSSDDGVAWRDIDSAAPPPWVPPLTRFRMGLQQIVGLASLSSDETTLVLAGATTQGGWISSDRGNTWTEAGFDPGWVEMTVSDLGFVGVSAQGVVFSADGSSWVQYPLDKSFHDIAAVGDVLVALAPDGIYAWSPPGEPLAHTGTTTAVLVIVGVALTAAGASVLFAQRWRIVPWVRR